ncbi:hypothetical protein LMG28140_03896 [Paraburkholderia metrosideri]|uniref:Uncharacterized protein n=1 Tax=Paraburkholderia metrosideri TaxID=580937 RepID=A0ABN7HXM9_9BURK|nr:hypothetical protein LMG28140_03896 [Paraburkholderia metrosideri]
MPQTNAGVSKLGEFTVRELARLHILNEALQEAEHWIREHLLGEQHSSESDSNTVGPSHMLPASDWSPRFTVSASLVCVTVAAEPGSAVIQSPAAPTDSTAVPRQVSVYMDANETPLADESLFGLRPCALFSALFTDLRGDWLQMLDVSALKVKLGGSACREFEVAPVLAPRTSNLSFGRARLQACACCHRRLD